MTLEPGARLGPYQILGPIGAGGMGEVYRARDTRLGREVAVKTLPQGMASDPERRARLEQEARSASALNHPNIISILDVGDDGGVSYVAMEHVEGKTLREIVASGPVPTRKALDLSVQLAEGLASAHGAGIVHRDLKPDNIIVSRDGFVKILDFGLAKLVETPRENVSDLPTAAKPGTTPGTVLGTVGYMSPEQASGHAVDFRSDQFSLGTILYEVVTGHRAFQRKTGPETLTAIIREDPEDLAKLSPRTPAPLRWIIERCLAKDPADRFVSTRDLARDLASVRDHLSETGVSGEAPAPARRRRWVAPAGLVLAGLLAGLTLGALAFQRAAPAAGDLRFTRLTYRRGNVMSGRFAPDGQSVVYGAAWEGRPSEIFSVRFDSPESRSLGLPSADLLAISSTGEVALSLGRRYLFGWESTGTLARVPLGGGAAPREVLEKIQEADWSPDGSKLAVVRDAGERRRLELPAGTVLYETAGWISHARVSPDGSRVAFIDHPERGDNIGSIVVTDLRGSHKTLRPFVGNGLAWSPDGREVWTASGAAVDLEGRTRRLLSLPGLTFLHDVSRDGRFLFSRSSAQREIVGRGRGATAERNLSWLDWSYPRDLSDDGTSVLLEEQNLGTGASTGYPIYLRKTDGSPAVKLGSGRALALSPDGRWALATAGTGDAAELLLMPTGAGQPKTLLKGATSYASGSWFPDGKRVLVSGIEPGHTSRLYVVELDGGKKNAISGEGVTVYNWRALSPDGRLAVAQAADLTMWVYSIDGGDPRPMPGATREDVPIRWTADSRGLYVQSSAEVPARVDVIDVTTGTRRPWRALTPPDPAGIVVMGPIKLSADGQSYVYSYRRVIDDLYVAEGLR